MIVKESVSAHTQETGCVHHWVIESPNGPTSRGTCKRCGEIREFRNSVPSHAWERELK